MTFRELRELAKHVVKFGDGTYLGWNSWSYKDRVKGQKEAQRLLTWSCAKFFAESLEFEGKGARAVRLVPRRQQVDLLPPVLFQPLEKLRRAR